MAERKRSKGSAEAHICAAVRAAILERRLAPGTKLPEHSLGAFFGVSRTIVRQALRTLAREGIVALRDRRIAVVARPSATDVAHVFAARRAIEGSVVEHAVSRATRGEIASLRKLVRDEEAAYRRGDRAEGLARSLEFHRRLGALCRNSVLERYLTELVLQTSLAVALYEQADAVHNHADHLALIDAIARRDAKRATRLMAEHLSVLERGLHLTAPREQPSLEAIFGKP
ncbi:MAG TPA: GntR family transcriptional regulator [Casimicrobiaceae bacterium]|nr:GntR family transcriptional regulator [Casimicrobiaceae bacterium]